LRERNAAPPKTCAAPQAQQKPRRAGSVGPRRKAFVFLRGLTPPARRGHPLIVVLLRLAVLRLVVVLLVLFRLVVLLILFGLIVLRLILFRLVLLWGRGGQLEAFQPPAGRLGVGPHRPHQGGDGRL